MLKEDPGLCPNCNAPIGENWVCPNCGYPVDGDRYNPVFLNPGVTLKKGRYLVGGVGGKNGEGATYDGFDYKSRETCWIREYFPTTLARRGAGTGEVAPLDGLEAQYKALSSDFVDICNEIKRLEVTERVIPVTDVFVENSTVYAVYQSLNVVSFDEYLSGIGGKLPVSKALEMFLPFCNMVGTIHDHGYIHRGISPFTVYVDEDDHLYLWDFSLSAIRTANAELDAELFNGYSAPEQYALNGWQGTWTDVYAVAALFYRTVSGFVPPKSTMIGEERPLSSLDDLVMDIPRNISAAVRDAMTVDTGERVQTIYDFTSRLIENEISNTAVFETKRTKKLAPESKPIPPQKTAYEREHPEPRHGDSGGFKYAMLALICTVALLIGGLWYFMNKYFPSMITQESSKPESHSIGELGEFSSGEGGSAVSPESAAPSENGTTVPRFVGQMLTVVQEDAHYKDKFTFKIEEDFNEDFPAGVIFNQEPEENTALANQDVVTLYVSKGPELATMPDLIGKNFDEALKILGDMNLSCDRIERYAAGAPVGSVVGTIPMPGEEFNPSEDKIEVYVMPQPLPDESTGEAGASSGNESGRREESRIPPAVRD